LVDFFLEKSQYPRNKLESVEFAIKPFHIF